MNWTHELAARSLAPRCVSRRAVDQGRDGAVIRGRLRVAAGVAAAVSRAVHGAAVPRHAGPCCSPSRRGCAVFDEYTSVVDRTVAQIGTAALAKTVRARGQQFVAVTCHEDVDRLAAAGLGLSSRRESLYLEVASTTSCHCAGRRSLSRIGVAAVRTASLSESRVWPDRRSVSSRRGTNGRSRSPPGCRSSVPGRRHAANIAP